MPEGPGSRVAGSSEEPEEDTASRPLIRAQKVCKQLAVASPRAGWWGSPWQGEVNGRWPLNLGSSVPITAPVF